MHIILGFLAILGGAAFWWWRLKMLSEATSEITDAAGRAVGRYKRYKFRRKVEDSPLEAVDDPVAAAVIMMFVIVQDAGSAMPAAEAAIRREVSSVMGVKDPSEVMVFAKWVAGHTVDPNNVSRRYAKLWIAALNQSERRELVAMVERVASSVAPLTAPQKTTVAKLRERLALDN